MEKLGALPTFVYSLLERFSLCELYWTEEMIAKKMTSEMSPTVESLRNSSFFVLLQLLLACYFTGCCTHSFTQSKEVPTFRELDSKTLRTWVVFSWVIISVTANQTISTFRIMAKNKNKFSRKQCSFFYQAYAYICI